MGGGERLRPLWSSYTRATDGIVFVVDSAAPDDLMEEARVELARVLKVGSRSVNCDEAVVILFHTKHKRAKM